jgi:hypothetical protein
LADPARHYRLSSADQASKLMILPLRPRLASNISAVPVVCSAAAEFLRRLAAEAVDAVFDEADVLDDELPDGLAELEELPALEDPDVADDADVAEALEEGAAGLKKVLPVLNPTFAAFVPPTRTVAVWFLPLTTSLPWGSSQAATWALP